MSFVRQPHAKADATAQEETTSVSQVCVPVMGARDLVRGMRASGASWGEAVGQVMGTFGADYAKEAFEAILDAQAGPAADGIVVQALDAIAAWDPNTANAWLCSALETGRIREWDDEDGYRGLHFAGRAWLVRLPERLKVEGRLDVMGCVSLMSLPSDLDVGENLDAQDCHTIRRIEGRVRVGGFLDMRSCRNLEGIAGQCDVGRDLGLHDCRRLATLPDGLRVGGALALHGCAKMEHLPADLKVGQWLNMRGCSAWDGVIPGDARIRGKILTRFHPGGISLREWRDMHASLDFYQLSERRAKPTVDADVSDMFTALRASGVSEGMALGHVAAVGGADIAQPCFDFVIRQGMPGDAMLGLLDEVATMVPEAAGQWLNAVLDDGRMEPWETVPWGKGIHLVGRDWVTRLPDDLQVDGTLDVSGCVHLSHLPVNMRVQDSFRAAGCVSLGKLPRGLWVGWNLCLTGCDAWDGKVPADAHVRGNMMTDRCKEAGLAYWRQAYPDGERTRQKPQA